MKTTFEKIKELSDKRNAERKASAEMYQKKIEEQQNIIDLQNSLLPTYAASGDFEKYGDAKEKIRKATDIIELAQSMMEGTKTGIVEVDHLPEYQQKERELKEAYSEAVKADWKELLKLSESMASIADRIDQKTDEANAIRADLREAFGGRRTGGNVITTHGMILSDIADLAETLKKIPGYEKKGIRV